MSNITTVEEIINIHDRLIKRYGGSMGLRDIGTLVHVVNRVNSNPKKPVIWKAAIFLKYIVGYHPFMDGNKRTGYSMAKTYLDSRYYKFTASKEDIFSFLIRLADEEASLNEIISWLKKNTLKVK